MRAKVAAFSTQRRSAPPRSPVGSTRIMCVIARRVKSMGDVRARAPRRARAAGSFFVRSGGVPKREPRRLHVLGQEIDNDAVLGAADSRRELNNVRVRLRDDDVTVFAVARANQLFGHVYGIQNEANAKGAPMSGARVQRETNARALGGEVAEQVRLAGEHRETDCTVGGFPPSRLAVATRSAALRGNRPERRHCGDG